jgi:hypothetical protein
VWARDLDPRECSGRMCEISRQRRSNRLIIPTVQDLDPWTSDRAAA